MNNNIEITELKGFNMALKPLTEDKIELVREWRNNPKIQKFMEYREEITPEMQKKWFNRISTSGRDFYFIIETDGKEVGLINIRDVDFNKKEGEPGIFIWDDEYLNSLTSFQAMVILLTFGYERLGLERMVIHVLKDNTRAKKFNLFFGYELSPYQEDIYNQEYILEKEKFLKKKIKIINYLK